MRLRRNERAPAGAGGVCAAAGAQVFRPWPNPERESECGCALIRARETIDTELINATLRGSYGYCNARAVRRNARSSQRKRSEEHTSELQSRGHLVCRLLLEKKKNKLTAKR